MKVSKRGLDAIVKHEAEVLEVYLDPIGLPTLGVGHLLTKAELAQYPVGTRITKEVSREFFAKDLGKFERAVESAVKVPINQNQFDALVSLAFNIGIGGFNRSSVVRQLNAGQPMLAANAFLAWNKAKVNGKLTVLKGLTNRREAERKLFLTPISAAAPPVQPPTPPDAKELTSEPIQQPATPPPTTSETVTVVKERTPIYVKIGAAVTALTGMGINVGTIIQSKLEAITPLQTLFVVIGLALVGIALLVYDHSAKRAHEKTLAKMKSAADPSSNTVELSR